MDSPLPVFKLERYFAKYEFNVKYMLSCSDPESFTMKEILDLADAECRTLWDTLTLGYTESTGHPLLKEEISKLYPGFTADQVLEVVPQEGIFMAMKVLAHICKRGTTEKPHVVATYPAYQSLYENLRSNGCDVSLWSAKTGKNGWFFDLEEFRNLLSENTKIVVVNFPHNPTGYIPSDEEWAKIVDMCKQREIFLFSDEMYRLTNNDNSVPYPSACTMYDKAITLFGLSKTFGLPGLRVGWLCTKNEQVMKAIAEIKDYVTICGSAPAEILAIIALRNKNKLLEKIQAIIHDNLQCLDDFFDEFKHLFTWHRPRASTTGFLELKSWTLTMGSGGAQGFCDALREECEILLLPSSMYDFEDRYVRLGFGRKNLREIIPKFREFLIKYDKEFEQPI